MKNEEEDIELIEGYVKHTLTRVEREEFERRLQGDPAFAERYEDYRTIMSGIHQHGEQEFLQELQGWDREMESQPEIKRSPLTTYLRIAAAFLILALAFTYFLINRADLTPPELVAEVFEPYPDVISTRGAATQAEALTAYSNGSFVEAIAAFEEWMRENPDNTEMRFYLGCSQLGAHRYADARQTFDALQGHTTRFTDQVDWYRALAYLGADRKQEAVGQLEEIVNIQGHDYSAPARALLERL
ncbi:MAG TPA: tetratricopeptide repeat protein [Chryseosolibacter sp.]